MEGEVGEKKIEELAFLFDLAFQNPWLFNELYDNYPFPGTSCNPKRFHILHSIFGTFSKLYRISIVKMTTV